MVYAVTRPYYTTNISCLRLHGCSYRGVRDLDVEGSKVMPVNKVEGGYRWGRSGKIYKTKAEAEKQGRAIYASGYGKRGTKKKTKKKT